MNYPSNGCLWQPAFVLHDSLMAAAIHNCYGERFFEYASLEADSLDSLGLELQFPYIETPQGTDSALRRAFPELVASVKTSGETDGQRYLEIYFRNGKAMHAIVVKDVRHGFSFDEHQNDTKPYVSEVIQTLA